MKFYLDKPDQNNSWLIIAMDGTDADGCVGWRVDAINTAEQGSKTLAVFPTFANANPRILGVVPLDLESTLRISVSPVRPLGSVANEHRDVDIELRRDFPDWMLDEGIKLDVWQISFDDKADALPKLDITSDARQPRGSEAKLAFVAPVDGNKIYAGRPSDEFEGPPVVDVRIRPRRMEDAEGTDERRSLELVLQSKESLPKEEPIEVEAEHLLAGRDVVPLLEEPNHRAVLNSFDTVTLKTDPTVVPLERQTADGESIGLGLHDRIVLISNRDCIFEYWLDDNRLEFAASNGLAVFQHYGDGEFVQDTDGVRQLYYDALIEDNKVRQKPLFEKIAHRPFKLPFSSHENHSLLLQFACYDLCQTINELPNAEPSLVPTTMRMFVGRPHLYFALAHPKFSELADLQYDDIEKRVPAREAILNYCKLYLIELFAVRHFDLGITAEDISDWCSNITANHAWNLYELVLSGAAEELIKFGVNFDTAAPLRFTKIYSKKRKEILNTFASKERPTPLRAKTLGSKFQALNDAIVSLKFLEGDWRLMEAIAERVSRESGIFLQSAPPKARTRINLTSYEHDVKPHHSPLRKVLSGQLSDIVPAALEHLDRRKVLDADTVLEVVTSWLIDDHERDINEVKDLLKKAGLQQHQLVDVLLAVLNKKHVMPKTNLGNVESATLNGYRDRCATRIGKDMVNAIIRASGVDPD